MPPPLPIEIRTREIQLRNGCRTSGLAKTGLAQSLAIATLPQMQALRSSNSLTVADSRSTRVRLNYNHTILRRGHPATSLHLLMGNCDAIIGHSAALPRNKLERVNDCIQCNALATVPILKVRLLRALQSRIVQQWRATRRSRRFDRTVPPNAKLHRHVARNVICSSNQRYIGAENLVITTSTSVASARAESWAEEHLTNAHKRARTGEYRQQRAFMRRILYLIKR
jgi:hypothetical protein